MVSFPRYLCKISGWSALFYILLIYSCFSNIHYYDLYGFKTNFRHEFLHALLQRELAPIGYVTILELGEERVIW